MSLVHQPYMLDTNVFNDALKGKISSAAFAGRRLLVTGVQAAELRATKETTKQAALLAKFAEIEPIPVLGSKLEIEIAVGKSIYGISPPNRQSARPSEPVSTKSGESHFFLPRFIRPPALACSGPSSNIAWLQPRHIPPCPCEKSR